jgi:6-phosphogluconolactonase
MKSHRPLSSLAASVAATVALLASAGCGGGKPESPKTYAYVAVFDPQTVASSVAQFQVRSDGLLQPLNPATVPAGDVIVGLSVSPAGNDLIALGYNAFLNFSINGEGKLAENPVISPPPALAAYPFTFTPDGRFLIVPGSLDGVSSYGVDASGTMTLISTAAAGENPCNAAVDPSGHFAYVSSFGDHTISAYKISPSGALTPMGTAATTFDEVYLLGFSPEGFLYSSGCCQSQSVTEYSVDPATGALTQLGIFSSASNQSSAPWAFAFNPTGTYAYVGNTDATLAGYTISSFTVDSVTGAMTRNGADTPTVGALVVAVDPSGRFLFALSQSGTIWQFKIGSTGTLVPNGTATLPGNVRVATSGAITFVQR